MRRGLSSPLWAGSWWLFGLSAGLLIFYFSARIGYTREPDTVQGQWSSCKTVTESRREGDNQMVTVTITATFKGMLNGVCEGAERETIRKDGTQNFSGSGLFTGEINGRAGTAVLTYSGTVDQKRLMTVHWVLDKGTDDLARIDGQGTLEGKQAHDQARDCGDAEPQSAWTGSYRANVGWPSPMNK